METTKQNDLIEMNKEKLETVERITALQRTAFSTLNINTQLAHNMLALISNLTTAISMLRGKPSRRNYDPGDAPRDDAHPEYDGGADAALDAAVCALAARVEKFANDDMRWSCVFVDSMNSSLQQWAKMEAAEAHYKAMNAKMIGRPSIALAPDIFQGAGGLWYAKLRNSGDNKDMPTIVGIGSDPAAAMVDFDRNFTDGAACRATFRHEEPSPEPPPTNPEKPTDDDETL